MPHCIPISARAASRLATPCASIWLARRLSGRLGLDGRIGEDRLARPSPIGRARPGDRPIALIPDPPATTPLAERFMGVTSVVWNEKRSVTLVADGPVEMLLVKSPGPDGDHRAMP